MKFFLLALLVSGALSAESDCEKIPSKQKCNKKSDGRCKWSNKNGVCKSLGGTGGLDLDAQIASIKQQVAHIKNRDLRKDEVVIGVTWGWPPYCYSTYETDPATGNAELVAKGFLYEVAKEACLRAGLKCSFAITNSWDCWTSDLQHGPVIQSGMYDMCLCYTVTPGRLAKALYPTNAEKGWTKQAEGGLLTLAEYQDPALRDPFGGLQSYWDWMKMDWNDGCDGQTMKLKDGVWKDKCNMSKGYEECSRTCHQGKIRIGLIEAWALRPESFNWVTNSWTGKIPDPSRVIFIDEHVDGHTGETSAIETYNHLAKALLDKTIDLAYTYANLLEAMVSEDCNVCSDTSVWRDGKLAWHQKKLWFSAGGASGFFKKGDIALRDAIDAGANDLIDNDSETYCDLCLQFWPDKDGCEGHCIGCGKAGINACKRKGT